MTDLANHDDADLVTMPSGRPHFRDMAREEFWIVAKAFFAPVYGLFLAWRELSESLRRVDGNTTDQADPDPAFTPAE